MRVDVYDETENRYTISLEGRVTRESALRVLDMVELLGGMRGTDRDAQRSREISKFERVRLVVEKQLAKKAEELGASLQVCFVNCTLTGTQYRVLSALCLAVDANVPFTGLAVGEVFDRFKRALDFRETTAQSVDHMAGIIHTQRGLNDIG